MISAVILTKNEEKNIVDCLERLSFCDEILVIDDNSQDRTVEIATNKGAAVFVHPLNNNFSKQRNFGLDKAKNGWVLFIDADERVADELKLEIQKNLRENKFDAFWLKRKDVLWGRKLNFGETGNKKFIRLGKKSFGKWEGRVHEKWIGAGKIGTLSGSLIHYPHQTLKEFLREINFYSTLRANELFEKKVKLNWHSVFFYPKAKFFINYFIKLGFLDGIPGFILALMMSFHSFLVRAKLWQLYQKK